jgi:hypothetical protein
MATPKICEVDNCDRAVVARGVCRRHYARLQRTGTLEARPWQRQAQCTVEGCGKDAWSGGLCEMHRWRVREHGEPGPPEPVNKRRRTERAPCSVEGCERPRKGRLYCHLHTERVRRTGSPGTVEPMFVKGRVKPGKAGYVRLTMPDGRRVLEHVLVKEQELGRRLVDGENVHHKNGIKSDNDPGNLELWLVMQPTGQRVTDLMAYIAEYHAPAMLSMLAERG